MIKGIIWNIFKIKIFKKNSPIYLSLKGDWNSLSQYELSVSFFSSYRKFCTYVSLSNNILIGCTFLLSIFHFLSSQLTVLPFWALKFDPWNYFATQWISCFPANICYVMKPKALSSKLQLVSLSLSSSSL